MMNTYALILEGMEACKEGKSMYDCPYDYSSLKREYWIEGFRRASKPPSLTSPPARYTPS